MVDLSDVGWALPCIAQHLGYCTTMGPHGLTMALLSNAGLLSVVLDNAPLHRGRAVRDTRPTLREQDMVVY